jgi:hypothetical protein
MRREPGAVVQPGLNTNFLDLAPLPDPATCHQQNNHFVNPREVFSLT